MISKENDMLVLIDHILRFIEMVKISTLNLRTNKIYHRKL